MWRLILLRSPPTSWLVDGWGRWTLCVCGVVKCWYHVRKIEQTPAEEDDNAFLHGRASASTVSGQFYSAAVHSAWPWRMRIARMLFSTLVSGNRRCKTCHWLSLSAFFQHQIRVLLHCQHFRNVQLWCKRFDARAHFLHTMSIELELRAVITAWCRW